MRQKFAIEIDGENRLTKQKKISGDTLLLFCPKGETDE
jgi:hypothetical protein